jgi:hypothetical protein
MTKTQITINGLSVKRQRNNKENTKKDVGKKDVGGNKNNNSDRRKSYQLIYSKKYMHNQELFERWNRILRFKASEYEHKARKNGEDLYI